MFSIKKETLGELSILFSNIFFALVAIFVKLVPGSFSGAYVSFFRFGTGIIFIVLIILLTKGSFKVQNKKYFILRGMFGAFAMILYFIAIKYTSSGRATLLTNTFPVFVAVFGVLFFKEKLFLNNIISIIICTIGIFFVFYDGSGYPRIGDLLGIISAISAGLAVHYVKKMRENNSALIAYLAVCIFGLLFSSYSIKETAAINYISFIFLMAVSLSALLAQFFMGYGFKFVSSTKGSIITFSKIPITIFFSFFIGEEITLRFIIGTVLVIAGLIINK